MTAVTLELTSSPCFAVVVVYLFGRFSWSKDFAHLTYCNLRKQPTFRDVTHHWFPHEMTGFARGETSCGVA